MTQEMDGHYWRAVIVELAEKLAGESGRRMQVLDLLMTIDADTKGGQTPMSEGVRQRLQDAVDVRGRLRKAVDHKHG